MEEVGEMIRHKSFVETGLTPLLASYGLAGTQGRIFHVKPYSGSDGNEGDSAHHAIKSLFGTSGALARMTEGQNDIALMYAESNTASLTTEYVSAAKSWNKDFCHIIGVNAGPFLGQRSRIAQTSTVKDIEDMITIAGDHCLVAGLEIYQGVASATATLERALVVSGGRNRIENCQISGIGDTSMDDAGSCSLAVTGGENYFKRCYIGLDTVLRGGAGALTEIHIPNSTSQTRTIFEDCIVMSYTSLTTWKAIQIDAGSAHTATWLKNCMLCNATNRTSVVTVTGAILHNGAGNVFMLGGGVFGYADISTVTNANILNLGYYGLETNTNHPGVARAATA
jgi:hypothetical protein